MNAQLKVTFGNMTSVAWEEDPKRLAFTFARYKFVAKMLANFRHVLEIGCGDSTGSEIVAQSVFSLTCIDCDEELLWSAQHRRFSRSLHDILKAPYPGVFNGIYALDVLEHIECENIFMQNACASLAKNGTLIIGMPSLESQVYASPRSKAGHVNCKTEDGLRELMDKYFHCVYLFGMNDETLHTGFGPMQHYRIAVCNTKKEITS